MIFIPRTEKLTHSFLYNQILVTQVNSHFPCYKRRFQKSRSVFTYFAFDLDLKNNVFVIYCRIYSNLQKQPEFSLTKMYLGGNKTLDIITVTVFTLA